MEQSGVGKDQLATILSQIQQKVGGGDEEDSDEAGGSESKGSSQLNEQAAKANAVAGEEEATGLGKRGWSGGWRGGRKMIPLVRSVWAAAHAHTPSRNLRDAWRTRSCGATG